MSNYISEMNEQEPLGADPIPHDSTPLSSAEVRRLRRIEEAARVFAFGHCWTVDEDGFHAVGVALDNLKAALESDRASDG